MPQGKRIVLASRPVGEPKSSDFRIEEYALPTPGDGQVLLRTVWLSLDPYMRGRMSDGPSYAAPVPIGGVMEGGTVNEVIASNHPALAKGDIVLARAGWQTHALADGKGLTKIDPKLAPISTAVGVLGMGHGDFQPAGHLVHGGARGPQLGDRVAGIEDDRRRDDGDLD